MSTHDCGLYGCRPYADAYYDNEGRLMYGHGWVDGRKHDKVMAVLRLHLEEPEEILCAMACEIVPSVG